MSEYQHKLAGIFPDAGAMEQAERLFLDKGFQTGQITPIRAEEAVEEQQHKIESESGAVRDEFIKDISMGTGVGGVAGAAGAAGISLGAPALFVSAPVVAPLMVLGYAATIGGVAGAIHGLHVKEDVLTAVVEDALKEGYPVLMIEARDKAEAEDAYKLMQSTMHIDEVKY